MKFTIPGAPCGKGRPRFARRGQFTRAYTPAKTANYENLVVLEFQNAGGTYLGDKVPVKVRIDAYYEIPKSTSKKTFREMVANLVFPTKKPDWDNIGKIVCDALNGIAYKDDAQIVDGHVVKHYSEVPYTEVLIEEVKRESLFD